jgi:hypothetical protein
LGDLVCAERNLIRASLKTHRESFTFLVLVSIVLALACEFLEFVIVGFTEVDEGSPLTWWPKLLNFTTFVALIGAVTISILRQNNILQSNRGMQLVCYILSIAVIPGCLLFLPGTIETQQETSQALQTIIVQQAIYVVSVASQVVVWFVIQKCKVAAGLLAQIALTALLAQANCCVLGLYLLNNPEGTGGDFVESDAAIFVELSLHSMSLIRLITLPAVLHLVLSYMGHDLLQQRASTAEQRRLHDFRHTIAKETFEQRRPTPMVLILSP